MSVASDLHSSLESMGFVQLLLAIVFLAAYTVACSPLFGGRGRLRATAIALLAAVGFVAATRPWAHGVLMVACAVAGLGLFSALGWVLSSVLNLRTPRLANEPAHALEEQFAEPVPSATAPRATTVTRIPAA